MAVLLGPSGLGLVGVYSSIVVLAGTVAGMGIGSSGVRQIAEAAGTGDRLRITRTVIVLSRVGLVLGTLGGLSLACLSVPLSIISFGNRDHTTEIAILGTTILIGAVTGAQGALLQGLRRIVDLARLKFLGSLASTLIGIPMIWLLGLQGIVPMMVVMSIVSLFCSWWFARKVAVVPVKVSWQESADEARVLLGFGIAFMTSSLLGSGVAFVTNLVIVRNLGMSAGGQYAAAFALAGTYAGFILNAMGTDFYPRLTAVAHDKKAMIRLVNEQAEVALLMAIPGILGTLVAAPWVVHGFYSDKFHVAVPVLQWLALGVLGRIVSWPVAYIQLATGDGRTFIATEVIGGVVQITLLLVLIPAFGVVGAGISFTMSYCAYSILILLIMKRRVNFAYTPKVKFLLFSGLALAAGMFFLMYGQPQGGRVSVGCILCAAVTWLCLRGLLERVPGHQLIRIGKFGTLLRRITFLSNERTSE